MGFGPQKRHTLPVFRGLGVHSPVGEVPGGRCCFQIQGGGSFSGALLIPPGKEIVRLGGKQPITAQIPPKDSLSSARLRSSSPSGGHPLS